MTANKRAARKGQQELRKGRWSGRNQIYHVSTATYGRQPIFLDLVAGRILIQTLQREDNAGHTATLAFVVMPVHLHWLVRLIDERSLSTCVNAIKSLSARRINAVNSSAGQLWQRGFYDRAIRRDDDLVAVARYIIANPLRAGIARSVREYALWDAAWI